MQNYSHTVYVCERVVRTSPTPQNHRRNNTFRCSKSLLLELVKKENSTNKRSKYCNNGGKNDWPIVSLSRKSLFGFWFGKGQNVCLQVHTVSYFDVLKIYIHWFRHSWKAFWIHGCSSLITFVFAVFMAIVISIIISSHIITFYPCF